ncbi:SMC-Scp complex subunit ScpB [Chitinophaga sancti]|uniref:SMC-Scp complex subunit ScpB n=1 Tax=Chitinophaga sancti TaxID=1004 RepID=A0A1K1PIC8_9BACT|nr:SMC-Scp complex subunit ScpB [Chitinophaga sancti]WQD59445.1 SMC-Scp complex subunit ScpB [Chitinophaga sancti]WQG88421.1 SMC-Scp complex subunit ScpB [Chitinophaga sancti]SFW47554.1 segregation and condensation protein B [Chitinophaga sancti]
MEISQIIPHVESLIFAADRPLPVLDITDLLNNALAFLEDRVTVDQVETAIEAIREKYSTEFYAFEVKESGGGFQFLTKKEYYQTVAQLNGDKFLKRLSTAALETLAIVAYKQPISKGEIEHIRGVSTDYSITKLLEKELIVISGRSETLPGKPLLYSTSKAFMDYFGLNSPNDLPKLKEVFEEDVQPTLIAGLENGNGAGDDAMILRVSENGELVEEEILLVIEDEVSGGQLELPLGQEDAVVEEDENEEDEVREDEVEEGEIEEGRAEEGEDVVAENEALSEEESTEEGDIVGEEEDDDFDDEEEDDDDEEDDEDDDDFEDEGDDFEGEDEENEDDDESNSK